MKNSQRIFIIIFVFAKLYKKFDERFVNKTNTTLSGMFEKTKRLCSFLGLNKNLGGLLFMVVLVGTGEKMAERFLPIYLIALGGGALTIGLLNGLDNLLSALYSFPGGYLSDRFGTKRALLIFNLMAMVGFYLSFSFPHGKLF